MYHRQYKLRHRRQTVWLREDMFGLTTRSCCQEGSFDSYKSIMQVSDVRREEGDHCFGTTESLASLRPCNYRCKQCQYEKGRVERSPYPELGGQSL